MAEEEKKNDEKGDHINLKVKDQDNSEVHFKVRQTTKFSKIFDAFCARKSLQPDSVRFLFDGQRVNANMTPKDLDMEDGDSLDAMMEQVGGF
ncbi:uncharacterized protein MICPUCDRAFT_33538 [Micromonas pusilla CCMP1545]|uniref:Small ubiquitin-related modifier n=2 Tax=Micromonas pusilla TaxID=38833 RepID=C1MTL0_MICPC|nr:uncharacterized protein MICPUCDRAFT_33538 [Micromonas pusilla CCMP1545]EEH57334.1 predicted protein [Micromonas pusilla CCMP1545]|eukprot:XP_003058879.1 predicted protein [Micromonas pusilla CCMP1545]